MTEQFKIYEKCPLCNGAGTMPASQSTPPSPCVMCKGIGKVAEKEVEGAEQEAIEISSLDTLTTKVDAIKTMLDSTVYGMQKMSSNLDDIMVKLDV